MRKLTNEEKVLRFLLNEYQSSKTTEVSIFRSDLETLEMKELDVTRAICALQADQKLIINTKSQHNDLSKFWKITLTSSGIYHFENKKEDVRHKAICVIAFIIPTIISIIALFT